MELQIVCVARILMEFTKTRVLHCFDFFFFYYAINKISESTMLHKIHLIQKMNWKISEFLFNILRNRKETLNFF